MHGWSTGPFAPDPPISSGERPSFWNKGREKFEAWPKQRLTPLSFRAPQRRLSWEDLTESFRADADAYLKMRAAPDIFEERANAPKKPLAISTVKAQSEHLRLAASVLVESGTPVEKVTSLAVLVEPDAFKTILRHYLDGANGQPNAFAICLARLSSRLHITMWRCRQSRSLG